MKGLSFKIIFASLLIAMAMALWLFFCQSQPEARAQMTAPRETTFEISTATAKNLSYANVTGIPIRWIELYGDADTLKALWLTGTVDQVVNSRTIDLGIAIRYGNISINKTIRTRTDLPNGLMLPDSAGKWSGIPDSLIKIVFNDTLTMTKNWAFKLETKEFSLLKLPMTAMLITPRVSKGTALKLLHTRNDTVIGTAIRADLGIMAWKIMATATATDSCSMRLGFQVRLRGADWSAAPNGEIYSVCDSLTLTSGTARSLPLLVPDVPWIRPVAIGNRRTGNVRIDSLIAYIR